jgi:hypothetical protein
LIKEKTEELQMLLKEFKDVFAWTYKDLPPKLAQHIIELDTSIPLAHQAKNKLNSNYVAPIKHDIDKLFGGGFIQLVEEVTWLSPIAVVLKKNGNLRNCVDFKKMNKATKKDPYPLPFFDEVLNTVTKYEAYSFLDGYLEYHQIFIAHEDRYKQLL